MTWADIVIGELRKCTDCGLCLAACPTFAPSRAEGDSPRGRVHLLASLLADGAAPTSPVSPGRATDPITLAHLTGCIESNACHSPCPTGVRFATARRLHRVATDSLDRAGFERRVAELIDTIARDPGADLTVRTVRALLADAGPDPARHGPRNGGVLVLAGTMLRLAAPIVADRLEAAVARHVPTLVRDPLLASALDMASGLLQDVGLSAEHDRAVTHVGELLATRRYERLTVAAFDLLSLRLAGDDLPPPVRVVPATSVLALTCPIASVDFPAEYRAADAPVLLTAGALSAVRELVDAKRSWLHGRPWVTGDSRDLVRFPGSRHVADLIASGGGTVTQLESNGREGLDVVDLCRELIAASSENPPGGEVAVAKTIARLLATSGFEMAWHEAVTERPNIVGRLKRGGGRRLILQAHTDTKPAVAPGATSRWTTDPLRAMERDGVLYGLGACDVKGGLAAQVLAACTLAATPGWSGELVVQAAADEEDGSRLGAEHLLALGLLTADGAIVAEPTGCAASLVQLGNAWAEITIGGRAAHAGTPERGQDAFRGSLRYIAELEALLAAAETDPAFPGHPRLNVGAVTMDGHPGTVPGECRLRCDIRVLPGREREATFAFYERAAESVRSGCEVTVSVRQYQGGGCQSHRIESTHPLVEALRLAQEETGQSARTIPFAGGTDARYFALAGTPAVVYGPGSLEQAHSPNEYVPVAELRLAEQQIRAAALTFLSGSGERP